MAADPDTFNDPEKVRQLLANAKRLGRDDIVLKCQLRLVELAGQNYDEDIEREFWMAVTAAEEFKTAQNGKTTRLSRTRQKYTRVGAVACITDWAVSEKVTEGFRILIDAGRPDLTGEAIAIRHSDRFPQQAVASARKKLEDHGVDISSLGSSTNGKS